MDRNPEHEDFWSLADEFIAQGAVEEGTMMGRHCLRAVPGGGFVATVDRSSGDLVAKLPRDRVDQLVSDGHGFPFAPAGKVFKEWVRIPADADATWESILGESIAFVS